MLQKMIKKLFRKGSGLTPKESRTVKGIAVLVIIAVSAFSLMFYEKKAGVEEPAVSVSEGENIEGRLEGILSGVKGAGKVKVMIVFKDNGKNTIAMNSEYSESEDGTVKSQQTAVMGSDKEAVVISQSIPDVQGVIVTASGAGDETVRENLKKAVAAALPVMPHRIEILVGE